MDLYSVFGGMGADDDWVCGHAVLEGVLRGRGGGMEDAGDDTSCLCCSGLLLLLLCWGCFVFGGVC